MKFEVEVCVDTVESAIIAQNAGASRVELCDNLPDGGTTPSFGTIAAARKNLSIGLNVIIRPRGGDFLYSDPEFDIMKKDIEICRNYGVDGVVIGLLKSDGSVDSERTASLVELANPMELTFHRAFDMASDPFQALSDIIGAGAKRILTSGQQNKAEDGVELIRQLVLKADDNIIIMPGSGINMLNIEMIARSTGAKEFHFTGRKTIESLMTFRKSGISMGGSPSGSEFIRKIADSEVIENIIRILERL